MTRRSRGRAHLAGRVNRAGAEVGSERETPRRRRGVSAQVHRFLHGGEGLVVTAEVVHQPRGVAPVNVRIGWHPPVPLY